MRKRKTTYPPPKTATRKPRTAGLPGDPGYVRPTVAAIDLTALAGRDDIAVGQRVRIGGEGLYSGETAVVDGEIRIRSQMYLSVSFDHRYIDGADAARFMSELVRLVSEPNLLMVRL